MKFLKKLFVLLGLLGGDIAHTSNIELNWKQYSAWLETNYPVAIKQLNPGATEQQLIALETLVGVKLPSDYRAWLSIHNGQNSESLGLLWSNEFLSTSRIIDEWKVMMKISQNQRDYVSESEPEGAIQPDWWNPHWIPIAADGSGNLQCIDLHPTAQGTFGQIIDFDHETVHRTVLATSFEDWVNDYVKDVVAGNYTYSDDYGRLMPIDEL